MYLLEEPKRQKVVKALTKASKLAEEPGFFERGCSVGLRRDSMERASRQDANIRSQATSPVESTPYVNSLDPACYLQIDFMAMKSSKVSLNFRSALERLRSQLVACGRRKISSNRFDKLRARE